MDADTSAAAFTLMLAGGYVGLGVAAVHRGVRAELRQSAVGVAAAVAAGAVGGSLGFSELAGFVPCELCWYQRAAMYPLALLLLTAAWRGCGPRLLLSARILAGVGLAVALYHVQLQWFPEQASWCALANPCSASWVQAFGVVTIPQLSALSFALILATLSLVEAGTPLEAALPERTPSDNADTGPADSRTAGSVD